MSKMIVFFMLAPLAATSLADEPLLVPQVRSFKAMKPFSRNFQKFMLPCIHIMTSMKILRKSIRMKPFLLIQ